MSELLQSWSVRDTTVRTFFADHPELETVLNALFLSSRGLLMAGRKSTPTDLRGEMLWQLWRTVYDYHEQSLFLLLSKQMDAAFALLRMSSEVARDIARMADDPVNFEMWMKKSQLKDDKVFKKAFRFDFDDPLEKSAYDLYALYSKFGTHGHLTSQFLSSKVDDSHPGDYAILAVTEGEIIRQLGLWCTSFVVIQQLCLKAFKTDLQKSSPEAVSIFFDCVKSVAPVSEALRAVKDDGA